MGKTADLTVVQKTTIDTLHKEGKTQKVIAKEAVHRALCPSTLIERRREGKDVVEKKCTSRRDNRTLERIVKQNPFKNVGEIHKEWTAAGVSASRTTTHRRMQDMGFSCRIPCVKPLLNNRQRQKRLAWAKDKKDWTAAEWSKVMFFFLFGSQRRWSLSLPVLTLIFPALLPCLVRDSLCTALQTKILWINWSLKAIDTIETWVSGNLTALTERSQRAIRWRVGEVANRVSCGSFRGGH